MTVDGDGRYAVSRRASLAPSALALAVSANGGSDFVALPSGTFRYLDEAAVLSRRRAARRCESQGEFPLLLMLPAASLDAADDDAATAAGVVVRGLSVRDVDVGNARCSGCWS